MTYTTPAHRVRLPQPKPGPLLLIQSGLFLGVLIAFGSILMDTADTAVWWLGFAQLALGPVVAAGLMRQWQDHGYQQGMGRFREHLINGAPGAETPGSRENENSP